MHSVYNIGWVLLYHKYMLMYIYIFANAKATQRKMLQEIEIMKERKHYSANLINNVRNMS